MIEFMSRHFIQGTWLKQRQQMQKDEQKDIISKDDPMTIEQSAQNSSGKSSDSSSLINEQLDLSTPTILPTFRRFHRHRPYSATLRSQIHQQDKDKDKDKTFVMKDFLQGNSSRCRDNEEYLFHSDSNEPLTKSALIYRLMRSRLEANLAKSISASRNRTNQKKKYSSTT